MTHRGLSLLICLLAVLGFALSMGCTLSEERRRLQGYVVQEDLKHMQDDFLWAIGSDEPSILYEDSFPPGP